MRLPNVRSVLAVCLFLIWLTSCSELGRVEQGLVIDYHEAAGEMTVITDSNPDDPKAPRYDVLPPKVVRIPEDPSRMGPAPEAGKLIDLDTEASRLVVYVAASGELTTIEFTLDKRTDGVYPDDPRVTEAELPRIDAATGSVTLYSPRTSQIVTIRVPAEHLSLPADSWQSGDEVRYYFSDPAQSLRLMNVSKTRST